MEEHRSEGVDISLTARRSREQNLGRKIGMNKFCRAVVIDQRQQLVAKAKSGHNALSVICDKNESGVKETVHHSTAIDLHREGTGEGERDLFDDQERIVHRNWKLLIHGPLENRAQGLGGNVIACHRGSAVIGDAVDAGGDIGGLQNGRDAIDPVERCDHITGRYLASVEDSQPNGALDTSTIKFSGTIEMTERIGKNLLELKIGCKYLEGSGHGFPPART
jgi:hypothetical protein